MSKGLNPTVYEQLMTDSLGAQEDEIRKYVERIVRGATVDLSDMLVEQLRKAYVAGVADGFRDAVIKIENDRLSPPTTELPQPKPGPAQPPDHSRPRRHE